jgi:hypothetical protein
MSLTIKPGYDFETFETPTREKLLRMATGLEVSGIDASYLDASLIAHKFTTSSGVTLPAEGWMWTDGAGNTWVEGANGPVRFFRTAGGWESNRYQFSGADFPKGNKLDCSGTAEESTVRLIGDTGHVGDGEVYSFVSHDTCVTGAYPIAVGRGGFVASIAASTQYYEPIKSLLRTPSSGAGSINWGVPIDYASNTTKVFPAAVIGHLFSQSLAYGWFYGRSMYGPGATL